MSKFDAETVRRVADLARLQLTESEVAKFATQVGDILTYIDKLNTLDTAGVEPLSSPLDLIPPLRADEARPSPGAETMLATAPDQLYDSYKVPQVMGGGN